MGSSQRATIFPLLLPLEKQWDRDNGGNLKNCVIERMVTRKFTLDYDVILTNIVAGIAVQIFLHGNASFS
jgi:hypothetical protein